MKNCIIITGGPELDETRLLQENREDSFVICADHGYDRARRLNIRPDLLLGDFDSMQSKREEIGIETLVYPCEKDDTDTVAAVKEVVKRGFTHVDLYGCSGGRIDHLMGNLACLLYLHHRGVKGVMYAPRQQITVIEGQYQMNGMKGKTISLLPAEGVAECVTLKGFFYPLSNYRMTAEYPIGVSNVVTEDTALIETNAPLYLIINEKV